MKWLIALLVGGTLIAGNVVAYHVLKEAPKAIVTHQIEKQVEKTVPPVVTEQVKKAIKVKKPSRSARQKAEMAKWCAEVKSYVAKYGEDVVRNAAVERGYTRSQIRAAGRCLR